MADPKELRGLVPPTSARHDLERPDESKVAVVPLGPAVPPRKTNEPAIFTNEPRWARKMERRGALEVLVNEARRWHECSDPFPEQSFLAAIRYVEAHESLWTTENDIRNILLAASCARDRRRWAVITTEVAVAGVGATSGLVYTVLKMDFTLVRDFLPLGLVTLVGAALAQGLFGFLVAKPESERLARWRSIYDRFLRRWRNLPGFPKNAGADK